jgi:hydrogenase maturation protein HypF
LIRLGAVFESILEDMEKGIPRSAISAKFHNGLVNVAVTLCKKIRESGGPEKTVLSGGVFQNRLLSEKMGSALEENGFTVLVHRQVPCNDGGLSLGQAVIANFIDYE